MTEFTNKCVVCIQYAGYLSQKFQELGLSQLIENRRIVEDLSKLRVYHLGTGHHVLEQVEDLWQKGGGCIVGSRGHTLALLVDFNLELTEKMNQHPDLRDMARQTQLFEDTELWRGEFNFIMRVRFFETKYCEHAHVIV